MDAICIKDLKKDLKREMDDSRYEHTLGVMYTSAALAMRYEVVDVGAQNCKSHFSQFVPLTSKCTGSSK